MTDSAGSQAEKDAFWTEQTKWLEADLAATQTAEYRFVVCHHPPFSAVASRASPIAYWKAIQRPAAAPSGSAWTNMFRLIPLRLIAPRMAGSVSPA